MSAESNASPAAATDVAVVKAIEAVLPGTRFSARPNGKEELVSMYRPPGENQTDCKVDATKIAKAVMIDKDFGFTRVRVQFHELAENADVYQEVVVSLAAIKGFSSGAVTKQEFLDSLEVQRLPESGITKPVAATASAAQASKPAEKIAATTGSAATSGSKPAKLTRFVSRRTGISFNLPAGWTATETVTGHTLVKLVTNQTKMVGIQLQFDGNLGTPEKRAADIRSQFNFSGVTFEKFLTRTSFGTASYPGAVVILTYPNWDNAGTHYYDMHLYFGQYSLYGWCPVSAYHVAGPAFEEIMRSMSFPTPTNAAAPLKSKTK